MDPSYHGQPHGYYTLYNFKVKRYLRGKGTSEVKIFQSGIATDSLVVVDDDDALMETGKKYIVFLKQISDGFSKKTGYVTFGIGSHCYKMAELDTYFMTAPCLSKVEIVNGTVHAARDRFRTFRDWRFAASNSSLFPESWRSLEIMGESEKGAVGVIAKAMQWADFFDRRSLGE